jgi:leucyl-tRNA synthetase
MHALSYKNPKFILKEPFEGLFTQGMVCHPTYKDKDNNWLNPDEIFQNENKKYFKKENPTEEVIVGNSESMSKSKKNTIDPENIIENFGADAVRLFILSDSPPEKDVQWSDQGMIASFKFIQKLSDLHEKISTKISDNEKADYDKELAKFTSQFINKVTDNLEKFHYNVIIANLHEMFNFLYKHIKKPINASELKEHYEKILILLIPFIPHFANECLQQITSTKEKKWPNVKKEDLIEKELNYVIQINGKKRGIINVDRNIEKEKLLEKVKAEETIVKFLKDKKIIKTIFVPNRLINIII